ncbi:LytR/AlgR family response regulator transcription factor [Pedobacter nutrimenti]|uniref:LytTR family two component transcriptional regulator n=1 Tax=Pedobacter nutrimenti TaxID=1241337 RepID=A0A318UT98_9SPHI|nr:LytTR family DNA-binding domain-containing protein [Pedobacter nutrimenti]PYF74849.1 LytTR family two component transcriptional regulator [Pedobacter nutrimenti]
MKVLIIEDERHNAKRLKTILTEIDPEIRVVAILEGINESISWFREQTEPDLIFTDVRLTDGLCFDIFSKVRPNCPIIFTSAFDEYALRAFKVNSIDYLLKPVKKVELEKSIHKFKTNKQAPNLTQVLDDVAAILKQQQKNYRTRFLVPNRDSFYTVRIEEIAYFYTEYRTTRAVMNHKQHHIIPFTMEELEEQLDPEVFFRISRQYLINYKSISHIHNYFNGKLHIVLKPEPSEKIIISRDKSRVFKQWLDR